MSSPSPDKKQPDDTTTTTDWRAQIAQSRRSAEVRAVADMLAKMEPGATASSKLMLAMRFEEDIFQKATSLGDYQKRIQKRLKKFAKNYKAATSVTATTTPTAAGSKGEQQERLLELKRKYGDKLKLILDNAEKAIDVINKKNEHDKAKILKQHIDNVKIWATDLGVVEGTTLNTAMDAKAIDDIQAHMERRVENIYINVMKVTDMDVLIQEALERFEHDLTESASNLLAAATSRRLVRIGWTDFANPVQALQKYLGEAQATIPPPTRSKESQRNAALAHLERMRAASQAILAFVAIANKESTALPSDVLLKSHTAAMQSLDFLAQVMPDLVEHKKVDEKTKPVELQDAWTKVLEIPETTTTTTDDSTDTTTLEQSTSKRAKTDNNNTSRSSAGSVVLSSRVLLTPNRKTPSNLLPELKRKGAKLVRPPPNGRGSHLLVRFDNAFCMTIYFCPLLVTIRATTTSTKDNPDNNNDSGGDDDDKYTTCWTPIQAGLESTTVGSSNKDKNELKLWGVTGSTSMLGHAVQGQLEYASARATAVLRKYFATSTVNAKNDFEVEISEGTALLQFLQLARTTYTPNYQEAD